MKKRAIKGILFVIRLALGVIFVISSISKLRQPYDFLASIYGFELVGPKIGLFFAIVLPWLELFVGICLIGGIFVKGPFWQALVCLRCSVLLLPLPYVEVLR